TLIGKGDTAIALLSPAGFWRERSKLRPVDMQGQAITPVKSTFETPVALDKKATMDEYLSHNIHLVYQLKGEADTTDLVKELGSGTVCAFPFSYRGGLEAYAGFLLLGADGNLFLTVGTKPALEFVGLRQAAAPAEEETGEEAEESLDFGMI